MLWFSYRLCRVVTACHTHMPSISKSPLIRVTVHRLIYDNMYLLTSVTSGARLLEGEKMKRQTMRALAELEDALVDAGVPEEQAARIVDSFEDKVEECLEDLEESRVGEPEDDAESEESEDEED